MSQQYPTGTPEDPVVIRRTTSFGPASPQLGKVTLVLIGICVAVAVWTNLGSNDEVRHFLISEYRWGLPEIRHGALWRLITPIFLHYGWVHIIFNMLWLKDLGTVIERRLGPRLLLGLVLVIGAISNFAQYSVSGSGAGGMSGVIYGLFGYIWMKSRVDPSSGFSVSQQTVMTMLVWLVLCYTGLLGNIGNTAHLTGLLAGVLWGLGAPRAGGDPRDISVA
jgi:GlpG protein